MGWAQRRDEVLDEAAGVVAAVEAVVAAGAWEARTTCGDWTAGHVATHIGSVMHAQQDAFATMLAGGTETPPWTDPPTADPDTATDGVRAAEAKARHVLGRLTDDHAGSPVPLPFGTFPAAAALEIALLEYGVHRWDLAHAVDPGAALSNAAAASILRQVPPFLVFYAAGTPAEPIGYRLEAPGTELHVSVRDGGWVLEPSDVATTTIGTDDPGALALFVMGRVPAGHAGLRVDGADAGEFKRWFPGP